MMTYTDGDAHDDRHAVCIHIFIDETQKWQGRPLYTTIIELAYQHEARCVVAVHGIEGFGPEHHLATERLVDVAYNLPIALDIILSENQATQLLPLLDQVTQRGMMTVTPITIINGETPTAY